MNFTCRGDNVFFFYLAGEQWKILTLKRLTFKEGPRTYRVRLHDSDLQKTEKCFLSSFSVYRPQRCQKDLSKQLKKSTNGEKINWYKDLKQGFSKLWSDVIW